jgi:ABC-type nitrate/sulfonate/bicarbonate transport system ATPase subunit
MIQIHDLTFSYPNQPPVFQDFSWQVEAGETWAIIGPSGCGKSTLLYLLAGLRLPSVGQVLIHQKEITRPRPKTGLIIQEYGLLPWATVSDNIGLGLKIRAFYGPDGTHAPKDFNPSIDIEPWLTRLHLREHRHKYPAQLSGGQRQRTAIARTLALQPDLILMDEPFASLDAPTRETLQQLTLDLGAEGRLTMLIVTHAIEEAAFLGEKILVLGQPPNSSPFIITNPHAGEDGFRHSPAYTQICRQLRAALDTFTIASPLDEPHHEEA